MSVRILKTGILFSLLLLWGSETIGTEKQSLAPNFVLRDLSDKKIELKQLLGKGPLVIDFWATWCKPCKEEFPQLQALYERYKDKGLEIVAISTDNPRTLSKVKAYIMGRRYTFKVLLDTDQEVRRLYKVRALPTTFLIDREGRIRYSYTGYRPGVEKVLENEVLKILETKKEGEK